VSDSSVEALRSIPLFAGLDDDALAMISRVCTEFEAGAGHVLIERGMDGAGMFVLEEGTVVVEIPSGRTVQYGPGDFFGELALLGGGPRTARVRASTPVRCLAIARSDFASLLETEPRIAVAMLPVLARRLADTTHA
jgi:CRP/FNR family transcriptional regulator, cyclic AMP receptor protein